MSDLRVEILRRLTTMAEPFTVCCYCGRRHLRWSVMGREWIRKRQEVGDLLDAAFRRFREGE